jgi:hypothetical protein
MKKMKLLFIKRLKFDCKLSQGFFSCFSEHEIDPKVKTGWRKPKPVRFLWRRKTSFMLRKPFYNLKRRKKSLVRQKVNLILLANMGLNEVKKNNLSQLLLSRY